MNYGNIKEEAISKKGGKCTKCTMRGDFEIELPKNRHFVTLKADHCKLRVFCKVVSSIVMPVQVNDTNVKTPCYRLEHVKRRPIVQDDGVVTLPVC
jgi:hypothetical protein